MFDESNQANIDLRYCQYSDGRRWYTMKDPFCYLVIYL